jgi:hypothetical protein
MGSKKNYPLRIDEEIFESLKKWADDELRSVNSHIEFLLRKELQEHRRNKKNKNLSGNE